MRGIVVFPDGSRFTDDNVKYWIASMGNVTISTQTSFPTDGVYVYTAANQDVANAIVLLLDNFVGGYNNSHLHIPNDIGMAIFTLSPNSGTAASNLTIDLAGQYFINGATATIGNVIVPVTLTDASDIILNYTGGQLAAGTYDIVVTNPDGKTFTLTQSLTLS